MQRDTSAPSLPEPPHAPKPKTHDLPDLPDGGSDWQSQINEDTDLASLTPAQLHELNQNMLDDSVASTLPLVAEVAPLGVLRAEYERGSESFVRQIDALAAQGFEGVRRIRGDGNCFYRAICFAYIERLFNARDKFLAVATTLSTLEAALPQLEAAGFHSMVIEECFETPRDLIRGVVEPADGHTLLTPAQLLEAFQDYSSSNYAVMFMRMLASAQIRGDPDEYAPFLTHPEIGEQMEVREFCEAFVEALGKEADHVQIAALSRALRVNVSIAYLDGRSADGHVEFVRFHNAIDENEPPLVLLYRPGHYDVLDRRSIEALPINI
ncbi:cysteine proteinase [Gloeopeniophorella convolvens]|nr:cysteine proteinase [Gloeopeniophorella convolvens]